MRVTLLSDLHLRGPDDPHLLDLLAFLEAWETDEWVLLGDVFDAWWGWQRSVYVEAVPLLAALHREVRGGRRVVWVPGNRDARPGAAVQGLGIQVRAEWRGLAGQQRVLAVHGDVEAGLVQRTVDRALRGRPTRAVASVLGPERLWPVLRGVSRASRRRNTKVDHELLRRQARFADAQLGSSIDVVCLGHSHAPGIEHRPGGTLVNLGDWLEHRTFGSLEPEGVELLRWTGAVAEPVTGAPARRC